MWRTVCILAALVAGAAVPVPAAAEDAGVAVRARIGDVRIGVVAGDPLGPHPGFRHRGLRDRPHRRPGLVERKLRRGALAREPVLFGSGPVNDFARDQATRAAREPEPRRRPVRRARPFVPYFIYDDAYYDPYYYDEPPRAEPEPAPAPPPAEAAPPEPPDARGPRFEPARGRGATGRDFAVGQPLPAGRPHVALDWEDYGLPQPPAGQGYARFAGAVLLIDTDTRVVRRVLWPTEG